MGARVGDWLLKSKLGQGGFGEVLHWINGVTKQEIGKIRIVVGGVRAVFMSSIYICMYIFRYILLIFLIPVRPTINTELHAQFWEMLIQHFISISFCLYFFLSFCVCVWSTAFLCVFLLISEGKTA